MSVAALRLRYGILAALTVAAGLAVHLHGASLPPALRDVIGDALWASMIYWLVGATAPAIARRWRIIAALAICFAVEFSQMVSSDLLRAARGTTIGHLVLGSDFDARDLFAYSIGVACASLADYWTTK
jgi:hypothetical protein